MVDRTEMLRFGDVRVDLRARRVHGPEGELTISENEARILGYLAARAGVAVSRDELQTAVLGYSPVTLSRAVDAAVARLRTKIEPRPTDPRYLLTVYGVGYRLEVGVAEPAPTPIPAARAVAPPPPPSPLVDRVTELAFLKAHLDRPGALVVCGPPGSGKTRIVREAVRGRPALFWVDLRDVSEAEGAVDAISRALAVGPGLPRGDAALGLAIARLPPDAVIVLDAADEVHASLVGAIDVIARVAPRAACIVTRRASLPGTPELHVEGLDPESATELFVKRAEAAGARVAPADRESVRRLCVDLAGIPLAIEHFAARANVLTPRELLTRLHHQPETLAGNDEDRLVAIARRAWSFLGEQERQGLVELFQFRAPFEVGDAERVLSASGGRTPVDVLRSLVQRSLVAERDRGRFEVYPLFRVAGLGRERAPDEAAYAASQQRWAAWCDDLARDAVDAAPTLDRLERVLNHEPDLRARFDAAVAAGDAEATTHVGLALSLLFERLGPTLPWFSLLDRALAVAGDHPRAAELRLHRAVLCFNTGRRDGGLADLRRVLAGGRLDPWRPYATALYETITALRADDVQAEPIYRRATDPPEAPSSIWRARAAFARGQLFRIVDRHGDAIASLRTAADEYAQDDDPIGESHSFRQLALAYVAAGDARAARAALKRVTALQRRCGRWNVTPNAEHYRGTILHEVGDLEEAEEAFRTGQAQARAAGLPTVAYDSSMGWLLVERERYAVARELLTSAWEAYQASGHVFNTAISAASLAFACVKLGALDDALEVLDPSLVVCRPGSAFPQLWVHGLAALIHLERDEVDDARRHYTCFEHLRAVHLTAAVPLADLVAGRIAGHRPLLQAQVPSSIARVAYRTFGANSRT